MATELYQNTPPPKSPKSQATIPAKQATVPGFSDMDAVKCDYTCVTSENNIKKNTLTIGGPVFMMNTLEPAGICIGNALDRLTAVTCHDYIDWCEGRVHMISTRAFSSCAAAMCFVAALCLSGCKDDSPKLSHMEKVSSHRLRYLLKGSQYYSEQLEKAANLWENGVCDPEPILFFAILGKWDSSDTVLGIFSSDEDNDLQGVIVREKHAADIFEETYPVFVGGGFHVPIYAEGITMARIRTQNQRKNEELWGQYVALAAEVGENEPLPAPPPMWVSIPEPNEVEVWVQLYDKAGHKSNQVKLRYIDHTQDPND